MTIRRSFADAAGGVAGSLVAMLVFYPIDVLKVNLQADKGNSSDNDTTEISKKRNITNMFRIMRSKYPSNLDFLKALFKGLHLKLAHTTTSSFAYFFIYSWIQSKHKIHVLSSSRHKGGDYKPSTAMRLILSAVAALCNTTLTLPLDVLASRSQVSCDTKHDDKQITPERTFNKFQIEEEKKDDDIPPAPPIATNQTIMDSVWKNVNDIDSDVDYDTANEDTNYSDDESKTDDTRFQLGNRNITCSEDRFYEECKDNYNETAHTYGHFLSKVDTRTQPFPKHKSSTSSVLNMTKREDQYKFTDLWRGIRPSLLLCSNPSIHFTVFDSIKDMLLRIKVKRGVENSKGLNMGEAFVIGLVAKFAATIATYPLIRAKVMLMVANKGNSSGHCKDDNTMIGILSSMFVKGGVVELYKGCSLQLVHTLLKSALLMMVRERISITTRRLILG